MKGKILFALLLLGNILSSFIGKAQSQNQNGGVGTPVGGILASVIIFGQKVDNSNKMFVDPVDGKIKNKLHTSKKPIVVAPVTCTGNTGICNLTCASASSNGPQVNIQWYYDSAVGTNGLPLGYNMVMSFDTLSMSDSLYGSQYAIDVINSFTKALKRNAPVTDLITDMKLLKGTNAGKAGLWIIEDSLFTVPVAGTKKTPASEMVYIRFWCNPYATMGPSKYTGIYKGLPAQYQLPVLTNSSGYAYPVTPIATPNLIFGGYWGCTPCTDDNGFWEGGIGCITPQLNGFPVYVQFYFDSVNNNTTTCWITFDTATLNQYNAANGIVNMAAANFVSNMNQSQIYNPTFIVDPDVTSQLPTPTNDTLGLSLVSLDTFNIQKPDGSFDVQISMQYVTYNVQPPNYYYPLPIGSTTCPCGPGSGGVIDTRNTKKNAKPAKKK